MSRRMRHFNPRGAGALLVLDARHVTGSSLSDTNPISRWDDWSGNNRPATQSSAGSQPLYRTNIQKGQPVIRFDGSNDSMVAPGIGAQPFSVFLLGRYGSAFNYFVDGVEGTNRAAVGDGLSGVGSRFAIYGGTAVVDTPWGATGSLNLWVATFNGISSSIYNYYNMASVGTVGTQGLPNGVLIGNRFTSAGYNLNGDIAFLAFLPSSSITLQRRIQQSIIISFKLTV